MDRPDTELALDGTDQRRTLEQRAGEGLEGSRELGLAAGNLVVEADDAEIFLSGALLGLDQPSGAVNARWGQYDRKRGTRGHKTYQTIRHPVTLGSNYSPVSNRVTPSNLTAGRPYSSGVTSLLAPAHPLALLTAYPQSPYKPQDALNP